MANSRLKTIRTYLRPHWRLASFGILSLLLVNIVSAYLPLLISNSIYRLKIGLSFAELSLQAIILLLLASLMWGMRMLSRIMIFGAGRQVELDLKQKIFQHLLTLESSTGGQK